MKKDNTEFSTLKRFLKFVDKDFAFKIRSMGLRAENLETRETKCLIPLYRSSSHFVSKDQSFAGIQIQNKIHIFFFLNGYFMTLEFQSMEFPKELFD